MNLGLIYHGDTFINHRSILKVLVNPFLRYIGWQIATPYNKVTHDLGWCVIQRCPKKEIVFSFDYALDDGDILVRKRRLI